VGGGGCAVVAARADDRRNGAEIATAHRLSCTLPTRFKPYLAILGDVGDIVEVALGCP
jgi:hypothetical protein